MGRDFGPQAISRGGTGSSSDISEAISQVINGRLECTPAYYQTDDDEAVQISVSNNTRLAVAIVPPVDMALSSISRYITAVVEEPNYGTDIYLYDNGSAKEPNGDLNGSDTPGSPTNMTANDAPSPYVVDVVDKDGNISPSGASTGAYKYFDGDTSVFLQAGNQYKYINNGGAAVDKGSGKVGIPITSHGIPAGEKIHILNTTNYNGVHTVEAETTANEIVITDTFVSETFTAVSRYSPLVSSEYPIHITLDMGSEEGKIFNKAIITANESEDSYFIKDVSVWGSNEDTPTPNTDTDWTSLHTESDITAPGDGGESHLSWTNNTAYRHYKLKITETQSVLSYPVQIAQIEFIEAQDEDAPGTLLETLPISPTVGDTADVWQTDTIDEGYEPQLQAGKKYWIVERL